MAAETGFPPPTEWIKKGWPHHVSPQEVARKVLDLTRKDIKPKNIREYPLIYIGRAVRSGRVPPDGSPQNSNQPAAEV